MNTSFEPANLLEIALQKAADDPASRPLFLGELLDSKILIIPAGEKPRIVNSVIPQDTKIGIMNIEFGGRQCVPFFTAECRLPPGTEYLLMEARAFFEITKGAYLVMNPGIAYGKEFFPDEVSRLLDGTIFEPRERYIAKKDMQVLIGQPKDYPTELVDALSRLYAKSTFVKRAWVAFYHNPERDAEGGLLIGLDVPNPREMERVSGESGIVIEGVARKQKFVDIIRYENSGISSYFTDQNPFYEKRSIKALWNRIRG